MHPASWGVLVALAVLAVYAATMSPTVGFIDSGELVAVAATLGIAHPTGYPLFSLLGAIAARMPIGSEEVVRLNAMAAVFTAAAVFVFFLVAFRLVSLVAGRGRKADDLLLLSACAGGTGMLAFSETFWKQAVAVEVYSLHLLLAGAALLAFLRAREERTRGSWYAAAYLLGLSFANHMTTIMLLPGALFLYFTGGPAGDWKWRTLLRSTGFFLLGLTPYLYLPFRAMASPVMNWGNPVTFERFFWHIRGKQFSVWIFSSAEAAGRQFSYFASSLPGEFAVVGLALGVVGLVALWRAHRRSAIATVLLFLTCVAYAINYDIHDIDSYFLLAYVCVGVWSVCGLYAIAFRVAGGKPALRSWVAAAVVACAMIPAVAHYREVDESENYLVEDYTRNMFASLRPGAVVFSFQWDYWVSASHYYQLVRGERTDIAVIDKELLRRSWYFHVLEQRYPWLIEDSRREVEAFLKELYKFEHDLPYAYEVIEGRYAAMIRSFIERSMVSRPVYVTAEMEPQYTAGFRRVTEGLAFRLVRADSQEVGPSMPEFRIRPFARKGRLEDMFWVFYARAWYSAGEQYRQLGRMEEAREAYAKAGRLQAAGSAGAAGAGFSR